MPCGAAPSWATCKVCAGIACVTVAITPSFPSTKHEYTAEFANEYEQCRVKAGLSDASAVLSVDSDPVAGGQWSNPALVYEAPAPSPNSMLCPLLRHGVWGDPLSGAIHYTVSPCNPGMPHVSHSAGALYTHLRGAAVQGQTTQRVLKVSAQNVVYSTKYKVDCQRAGSTDATLKDLQVPCPAQDILAVTAHPSLPGSPKWHADESEPSGGDTYAGWNPS